MALSGAGNVAGNAAQIAATIDQIRSKFAALPKDASDSSKRAYESAITQAAEFAVKTNTSMGSVIQTQSSLASSFTGTSNVMADKLSKVSQAFSRAFSDGSRDIRKLTIDYETFVRIVTTQAVIKALNALQNAFSESVKSAAEFQTKVAQIRTISGDLGTEGIAASARKVSDAFNIPLIDSANALYQTFSNQVGTTTQSLEFFAETGKFAKGSVTSMKDSVDLLSGVLNSYGLSAEHTGEVSGKLFKTIELGRVTGTELANSFGRVGVAAKEMGIPLDDVLAAFTTITRNGVKTSEAITQLRGVITALSKPTRRDVAALQNWATRRRKMRSSQQPGRASEEAGQHDGRNLGVVRKTVPNVRGLNFAILAGKSQNATYASDLAEIGKAGKELNDEKANIVINTDAQKAEGELNKLKNFLTVDFGQAVLKAVADIAQFTGGADNVITVVKGMTPVIAAGAAALGLYATQVGSRSLPGRTSLANPSVSHLGHPGVWGGRRRRPGDRRFHQSSEPGPDRRAGQTDRRAGQGPRGCGCQGTGDRLEDRRRQGQGRPRHDFPVEGPVFPGCGQRPGRRTSNLEATTARSFNKIVSAREGLVNDLRKQEEGARQSQIDSQDRVADLVAHPRRDRSTDD